MGIPKSAILRGLLISKKKESILRITICNLKEP